MERRWEWMLDQAVFLYGYWTDFLYFSRAKFAVLVANGIRMPFFSQLNSESKTVINISIPIFKR